MKHDEDQTKLLTPIVEQWPITRVTGAKRAHVRVAALPDWFVGYGKDEGCTFEGTWWDMICFARNVLASENTKRAAPNFYHPEMANGNYLGPAPYEFTGKEQESITLDPLVRKMLDQQMEENIMGQLAFQRSGKKPWYDKEKP